MSGEARNASVVCVTACELYCLQRTALQCIAKEWPSFVADLQCKRVERYFAEPLSTRNSSKEHG